LLLTTRDETLAAALGATVCRLDTLPPDEALGLLKAHAGVAVVEADLQAAEALLKVMGHLPLAIELAGKRLILLARKPGYRLKKLGEAVAQRATETLVLPGHPGLAATFAITYEALPAELRRVFRWLGVFAVGPLHVIRVAGVMELNEIEAEVALDALVPPALLAWGDTGGVYTLHPLLHQYAQALLAEAGEVDEAKQKHLAHHLAFAQANAQAEPSVWDRLEGALPNLLLAVKRATEARDSAALVSFEEALLHDSLFLNVRGYYREAVDLFSRSLEVQESLDEQQNRPRTLNKLAWFYMRLGQYEEAQKRAGEAYGLAITLDDQEQQADGLHYLGILFSDQGQHELALNHFEKQLEIRRELDNPSRLANCLNSLGVEQIALGSYVEAKQHLDEAIASYEKIGDQQGIVMCVGNRGASLLCVGDYVNAINDFETALSQGKELGDLYTIAQNLHNRGMVQGYLGSFSLSLQSLGDALSLWREIGNPANEAFTLITLAEVYSALGDNQRAMEYLRAIEAQIGEKREAEVEYLNTLGIVYYELGDYERALESYLRMEALVVETDQKYYLAQNRLGLSRTCLARGGEDDLENARRYAIEAINLCRKSQLAGDEPRGHAYLGKANLMLGDKETALRNCQETMRLLGRQKRVRGSEVEVHLISLQVLAANSLEGERQRYLERAHGLVQATAAGIEDEALQQSYLTVPVNREIVETWEREISESARLKPSR
jgi:tetratricopeptide (TPR) repeat protein